MAKLPDISGKDPFRDVVWCSNRVCKKTNCRLHRNNWIATCCVSYRDLRGSKDCPKRKD
jgi:hypothetical protein